MKKAKPIKITKMDKKDSYGNTSFVIDMDNSDSGFYTSKNENQTKFVVGQEVEYDIVQKIGGTGKPYNKISMPQSDQPAGGNWQKGGKPAPEPRIQMISFAMAYTKDLVVAGKVDLKDMGKQFDTMYNEMISKL